MSDDTHPAPTGDDDGGTGPGGSPRLRWGYVPGATPGRWARTWEQRITDVPLELVPLAAADVPAALRDGDVEAALARLPVDKDVFHAIPLYDELPVVVVSRDHLLAATEESERVTTDDLADDVLWVPRDDVLFGAGAERPGRPPEPYDDGSGTLVAPEPLTTEEAIAWAAAGSGVVVVPMSLARLHHRKDTVFRVVEGLPEASVGLVWLRDRSEDEMTELVDELVGIVRGRTANSSRGRGAPAEPAPQKVKAADKAAARAGKGRSAAGKDAGAGRGRGRAAGGRGGGTKGKGRPSNGRRGR